MTDEKRLKRALDSNRVNEPEETFNFIYDTYKPLVTFIIAKYIKDVDDIEDIVQDTFIDFFRYADKVHTSLRSYLATSAKHNALDFLKKSKRMTYIDVEQINLIHSDSYRKYSNDKMVLLIDQMKQQLEKDDVEIILLHLLENFTFSEIALQKQQNVKSIKTKYYRALKKFQKAKEFHDV